MIRILSILPAIGHPRDSKRISMLQQSGFYVEAVAFERNNHRGRLPNCSIEILGAINDGHYLERCLKLATVVPVLRHAIKRSHLIYASGPDMASIAVIASIGLNKPVIVEVGDIRKIQVDSGLCGKIVREFDRFFVSACSLLIATAPGFVKNYYRQRLHVKTQAMILENKLEPHNPEGIMLETQPLVEGQPLADRPLRIGYFGILRCTWSWHVLETLATIMSDQFEIIVAGIPIAPDDLKERSLKIANIQFKGPYCSPQDLPILYGGVDLVWGCYPSPEQNDWNWKWARTNRFYESCFFQKPIISLKGSSDAAEVEHYGIGMSLGGDDTIESAVYQLSRLTLDNLLLWQKNLKKLPENVYMYTSEIDEFKYAIEKIAGRRFKSQN